MRIIWNHLNKLDSDTMKNNKEIEIPRGRIQWKGTDVCMDIDCTCGKLSHIDAHFAYYFRCSCNKIYEISSYVKLIEVQESDISGVSPGCIVQDFSKDD